MTITNYFKSTKIANFEFKDGIVYVLCHDNIDVTIDVLDDLIPIIEEICGENKYPFLVDTGKNGKISKKARQYMADVFKKYRTAEAFVTSTILHKTLAQLYISINRPGNPIKVFTNRHDAEKWLKDNYV